MSGHLAPLCIALALSGAIAGWVAPSRAQVLPLLAADRQEIDALLGPGVVGEALPSTPLTDVAVYFPLQERTSNYLVISGAQPGSTQPLNVERGKRPDGEPAWRFALSPSQKAFLRKTADGDILMPAVSDFGEGVVVVTTPPNPFLLGGMQPGESRNLTQSVAVNYLDDPSRQDYSGTLTATYTYVGTYRVTVPAGTYDAILLRLKYAGKVGPAHTEDTAYYFFALQVGVVAMIAQEDVEAFWVIHIDHSSGKVLASQQ
ncbi:MAG: hypothetical protein ABI629_08410 [bacterium]